jgi:hypothetical protein
MSGDGTSRLNGTRWPGRRRWVAGLLPVVALVCAAAGWIILSVWTKAEPPSSQTAGLATPPGTTKATARETALAVNPVPGPGSAPVEPLAVNGLKISSQSWRRGGLGSKALITFTLRNDNPYAVRDIEITCSFSREDGSHLTDRKRIISDAVVNTKTRKTFAQVTIGFVNVDANKAKCVPVAASRV